MKSKKAKIIVFSALAVIVAASCVFLFVPKKEVIYNTAKVQHGNIEVTVMATGYIQPVEDVEVGTQVSGVIEEIYVDYNSYVKKGQLLARLDTLTLREKVNQSKASFRSSQSDLDYARQNYNRIKKLYDAKAATLVSLEEATNKLTQAQTTVENAKANLSQAEVNLSYAYIYSPIDGVVLDRAVNIGQTVAASFSTPTLFTIAEDLTKMQVEADVDEADIGHVKVGQRVTFTVDAYNDDVFTGTVSQVRLQATVTSNVVTYTVIIEAPNPEEKLFPNMTANVTIITQEQSGLQVPVEATNFTLTEELIKHIGSENIKPINNPSETHKVWIKKGDQLEERALKTGLNDGIYYIAESGVSEGDQMLLSATIGKKEKTQKGVSIMPSPRGGGGPPR